MITIELVSFGYKYGEENGDLKFDLRFIDNPYYIDELRPLSGLDKACSDYVFSFPVAQEVYIQLKELILTMTGAFLVKGRAVLKICIGCTGGQHRSVSFVEALAKDARAAGYTVTVRHREMEAGRF